MLPSGARPGRLLLAPLLLMAVVVLAVGCRSAQAPQPVGMATARSGPLALSPDGRSLWVVNPDAGSVTRVDTGTLVADAPIPVGEEPWSVAVAPDGTVVVADRAAGRLAVIGPGGHLTHVSVGPEPWAVALSPSGDSAYVTLASGGQLVEVYLRTGTVTRRVPLAPAPSALVVVPTPDGRGVSQVVVAHLLAQLLPGGGPDQNYGMRGVLSVVSSDMAAVTELSVEPYTFGFANLLYGLDVYGGSAWVAHSLNQPEEPAGFNRMVSTAMSEVQLDGAETLGEGANPRSDGASARVESASTRAPMRLELNDPLFSTPVNSPTSVALTRDGRFAYLTLGGSDVLMGIDVSDPAVPRLIGFWPTGVNPRGVVLSRDGRTAYVMNYLSRDVSVIDLSDPRNRTGGARVKVVGETLDPQTLTGKRLFFNANDPRISTLGWISCASCHPDGGSDGTTWTLPEGPRQTAPLWQLALRGPPFHASATRDELQDVEFDIVNLMRGEGLAKGPAYPLLGAPNSGRSEALDALAAFIANGFRVPRAPETTGDAVRGRQVFASAGCAACHGGPGWTRNALPGEPGTVAGPGGEQVEAVLIDVGTYPDDQPGLGANGFKPPTLLGLHASAPYLHNGSASDLYEVLANPQHVGVVPGADFHDLVAFLLNIDGETEPFE